MLLLLLTYFSSTTTLLYFYLRLHIMLDTTSNFFEIPHTQTSNFHVGDAGMLCLGRQICNPARPILADELSNAI